MDLSFFILLGLGIILQNAVQGASADSTCEAKSTSNRTLNVLINSWRDEDGEWLTKFHASKVDCKTTNLMLDLTQSVYQCKDGQAVHIKGLIFGKTANGTESNHSDGLKFHPKCGTNAAISDNGRTVQKIKLDDPINGVLLTHRPLRRNELFEVRMDKKNNKYSYAMAIGVTLNTPESFNIPDHMYNLKSGNWMMYHSNVYVNGVEAVKNYGKNLNELQVGDRVGVLVNNLGTLHFFVNGVDQGPAASNLPAIVHGVFELYYNTIQGTIVDPQ